MYQLSEFTHTAVSWAEAAAAFLESGDPIGLLAREFLIAIVIALSSSGLINFFIVRRERKRLKKERRPMRELVLGILAQAHEEVFEALSTFDAKNYKRIETRLRHLGDEIMRIRNETAAQVFGGLPYFAGDERAAIAAYIAGLDWRGISTSSAADRWQREASLRLKAVKSACNDSRLSGWTAEQTNAIAEHLKRLEDTFSGVSAVSLVGTAAR
ncbi:MAG: hypothetical protein JO348_03225 [Alphaproteobacteria bacterium]|nr:hypothetical protein [Alphaproteobacteria bacterium]MBV9905089.1 hypothetical protein [Alphaproteobacteria bacterium]